MKPIKTEQCDEYVTRPGVEPMPAYINADGHVTTVWALDDADRAAIAAGGNISLSAWDHPAPPVSMTVVGPWSSAHERPMEWSPELQAWTCSENE